MSQEACCPLPRDRMGAFPLENSRCPFLSFDPMASTLWWGSWPFSREWSLCGAPRAESCPGAWSVGFPGRKAGCPWSLQGCRVRELVPTEGQGQERPSMLSVPAPQQAAINRPPLPTGPPQVPMLKEQPAARMAPCRSGDFNSRSSNWKGLWISGKLQPEGQAHIVAQATVGGLWQHQSHLVSLTHLPDASGRASW